ncbi:uncharacterized protein TRIADDRAFT_60265 [Trichoplax adhaerens]|uniref:Alpha-mannosidase n=1 Tax=Trichoplax adhaerens TaxID=10228 RepID=B3S7R6_TRIAD|nr:hypothetical protein TRIADDRAFT_60265 [Trichoplax adhaerens]EDV21338.1 hypothetical protein TRIADDRAFT_60265 [Trichoplax adhaerens]|eukprot:XP_002116305.1 hypothetical protein TRIADDRAFT_60265 [Trichoplax adhaerens]
MKRRILLFSAGVFLVMFFTMHMVVDQMAQPDTDNTIDETKKKLVKLNEEIDQLKSSLTKTQNALVPGLDNTNYKSKALVSVDSTGCGFAQSEAGLSADIRMLDIYKIIPFDNPDGGAWKQGWDISVPSGAFDNEILQVFVVPHSHNDPGWIKTFQRYYMDQSKHIISNVVANLIGNPNRKFIWAEISFLSLWWNDASSSQRESFKRLVKNGQLEIVTGGWVMNDEANTNYYAMIDQMIEGHEWVRLNIGIKPRVSWSIDPFGYTPTMAYLLKRMGMDAMLIQRVHYSVKKYLAQKKQLEFMWRQNWDHGTDTDILCHVMPFYSYDIPHTCGPDPAVCCQFDFQRLPGGGIWCPWNIPPQPISPRNVQQRAMMLLEQYRKKSRLYRSNVVLAPLGDDFRYADPQEPVRQFTNYEKLFQYLNSKPELKVKIQFGTLSDYFNALLKTTGKNDDGSPKGYPKLGGDFMTYADRDEHYWSGYYTSRPFYKNLDRVLETKHRAAEIAYSIASRIANQEKIAKFATNQFNLLVKSRRNLGLFQHHDGITGTAKDHVVVDYGNRLVQSVGNMQNVIASAAKLLMLKHKESYSSDEIRFDMDESRASHDSLPEKRLLSISNTRVVVFYNSLAQKRKELVSVHVSVPNVKVLDADGNSIKCQVNLQWKNKNSPRDNKFEVLFPIEVLGLGFSRVTIQKTDGSSDGCKPSKTSIYHHKVKNDLVKGFDVRNADCGKQYITMENQFIVADFDRCTGLLQNIADKSTGIKRTAELRFLQYMTVSSGAYLFLPSGTAKEVLIQKPFFRHISGILRDEIQAFYPNVYHNIKLANTNGIDSRSLHIHNLVDIRDTSNRELIMRISTNIRNTNREYFTDLNGFQMQRRRTLDKIPLQANYYPMPSMAFLQDPKLRMTLHTMQACGVASLKQGEFEVMLDRRLGQDDNRGLGQGVRDNKQTPYHFALLLENLTKKQTMVKSKIPIAYPSLVGHAVSQTVNHPINIMFGTSEVIPDSLLKQYSPLKSGSFPCDLHLVTARTVQGEGDSKPTDETAVVLHRYGYDCGYGMTPLLCFPLGSKIEFKSLWNLGVRNFKETSLTMMHDGNERGGEESIDLTLQPMELYTYKVKFSG